MTAKKPSLAEFAAEKAPPPCRVCIMPERAEMDASYLNGIPRRLILEWLLETRGYVSGPGVKGITNNALDRHYSNRHHLKGDTA